MTDDEKVELPTPGHAPAEIEAQLRRSERRLRRFTTFVLVLLLAGNGYALGAGLSRGAENQAILKTLKANNGPEALAAQAAYLQVFRYQIDCDGQHREERGDNEIVRIVSQFVPDLRTVKPIDLAGDAESCKKLPGAERDLAKAIDLLNRARAHSK